MKHRKRLKDEVDQLVAAARRSRIAARRCRIRAGELLQRAADLERDADQKLGMADWRRSVLQRNEANARERCRARLGRALDYATGARP